MLLQSSGTAAHTGSEAARLTDLLTQLVKLQMLLEGHFIRPELAPQSGLVAAPSKFMKAKMGNETFANNPCQPAASLPRAPP